MLTWDPPSCPTSCAKRRSTTIAGRRPASSPWSRPSRWPTSATCRSPTRPASPPPAELIAADPLEAANLTARGNLVGVITNGTAVLGLGAIGAARRQAGDGRQGGPVQEVRRHRRLRHRDRRARPGQAGRDRRRAGADLRRDQPRGHQGAGVLRGRGASCARACASRSSTTTSTAPRSSSPPRSSTACIWSASRSTRSRLVACGAGAAALACLDLLVALGLRREHILVVDIEGVVYAGRTDADGPVQGALRAATPRSARWPRRSTGADVFLGLSAPRVLEPAMVRTHGRAAADPGARQPGARDRPGGGARGAARCDHRHRPQRLPEPGQQRPRLPVHLPRRPRRRRDHDQRGDEDRLRRGDRRGSRAPPRPRPWPRPMA